MMESLVPDYDLFGEIRGRIGTGLTNIVPSNTYTTTRDGQSVVIAGNADSIYKRLMHAIGRDDLGQDPALANNVGASSARRRSTARSATGRRTHDLDDILDRARRRPTCRTARSTPQPTSSTTRNILAREMIRDDAPRRHDAQAAGHRAEALRDARRDGVGRSGAGRAHRRRCCAGSGYSDEEIARLRAAGTMMRAQTTCKRFHPRRRRARRLPDRAEFDSHRAQDRADRSACPRPAWPRSRRPRSSRPRRSRNLRDAAEVMAGIRRNPGVTYVALVPNARGAERALAAEVDEIVMVVVGVGDAQPRQRAAQRRASRSPAFARCSTSLRGSRTRCRRRVATAFGCPFEGVRARSAGSSIASRATSISASRGVTFGDTTGMANPRQVEQARRARPASAGPICRADAALPQHARHGARQRGRGRRRGRRALRRLPRRPGRLPIRAGATGNVCTEDVVHMLQCMGYDTGVESRSAARGIAGVWARSSATSCPGQVVKAGKVDRSARAAGGAREPSPR